MRLIDADALNAAFLDYPKMLTFNGGFCAVNLDAVLLEIRKAPTIEAEHVRHGRWVDRYGGKYANPLCECSECKEKALYKYEVDVLDNGHFVQALSNACPHCRAKMDGGTDHEE